jgi:hypothetical protein
MELKHIVRRFHGIFNSSTRQNTGEEVFFVEMKILCVTFSLEDVIGERGE